MCSASAPIGSARSPSFSGCRHVAHCEGLRVVKHSHGELGIAAAASHHVLLTLPNIVDGNQHTAHIMQDDILKHPLPIATGPDWGLPQGSGLGIEVDEDKVARYHQEYRERGQYLPYDTARWQTSGRVVR